MIQSSRKPALAILAATGLAAIIYTWNTAANARVTTGPTLAELEIAIADPSADLGTWMLYAQRLQDDGRSRHAAVAYERVLEEDPCSRAANLQCALAWADSGDADQLHDCLSRLILVDPRLAEDVLGRPETRSFMAEPRFERLLQQARAQAMD